MKNFVVTVQIKVSFDDECSLSEALSMVEDNLDTLSGDITGHVALEIREVDDEDEDDE